MRTRRPFTQKNSTRITYCRAKYLGCCFQKRTKLVKVQRKENGELDWQMPPGEQKRVNAALSKHEKECEHLRQNGSAVPSNPAKLEPQQVRPPSPPSPHHSPVIPKLSIGRQTFAAPPLTLNVSEELRFSSAEESDTDVPATSVVLQTLCAYERDLAHSIHLPLPRNPFPEPSETHEMFAQESRKLRDTHQQEYRQALQTLYQTAFRNFGMTLPLS